MTRTGIKNLIALILNIAEVLTVAAAIGWFFVGEGLESGAGNMDAGGFACLIFFTNDSNILAALCCLVMLPFNIKSVISGKNEIPAWAFILKFVGTLAVTLTFTVVMVFLGPLMGYSLMFADNCLFLHLVCPLIAIAAFCFCEEGLRLTKKQVLWGLIPTFIYGTVYLINVVFTGIWEDFYNFNIGGFWYISCFILPAVTYILGLGLRALHNLFEK